MIKAFGNNLLILIFIYSVGAFGHGGFAPPIDSTNSAGRSHSGFGNLGGNDYEASQVLRKTCLEEDLNQLKSDIELSCSPTTKDSNFDLSEFLSTGTTLLTQNKLQSYMASVLSSELKLLTGTNTEKNSCHGINPITPAPHEEVRKSALSVNNAVSAALIDSMFSGQAPDYQERIKRNYPYLYNPKDAKKDILSVVKSALGDAYKSSGNMFDHYSTVTAFEAKAIVDKTFKEDIEKTVKKVQREYAKNVKSTLDNVCSMSMRDIAADYPGILDQYIIDSKPIDRKVAQYSLCRKDFYYNSKKFDSDCDGVKDDEDESPKDPLVPTSEVNVVGKNYTHPPFTIKAKYQLSKVEEDVKLTRKIKINSSGMSEEQREKILAQFGTCRDLVKENIQKSYGEFKSTSSVFKDANLELDLEFEESTSNVDFKVHKCWCSTCTLKYKDADGNVRSVPKDTCKEDFTPEMTAALEDKVLNPDDSRRRWFLQADASNLNEGSLSNCKTIQHEIMHKLGLSDEYVADYYPFNLVGEHDSLMNGGNDLKPRHIGDLLSPKKCERVAGNYGL